MEITVYGAGYVGLVTGACLAEVGHQVLCIEIDESKLALLEAGKCPIYEPGLEELLTENIKKGKIKFSSKPEEGVSHAKYQFIAVGTPSDEDGSADLAYVLACAETIANLMTDDKVIITKSTVPVGTNHTIKALVESKLNDSGKSCRVAVASNPEFLKEGAAIVDFMEPDRVVIGADSPEIQEQVAAIYHPVVKEAHEKIQVFDILSAEMVKYAANAMLATKISFINEMSRVAEAVGADIESVRAGIATDKRIGPYFISPGCGYGGSCFPKDVKALIHTAESNDVQPELLNAVEQVNKNQKQVLFTQLKRYFEGTLINQRIGILGLAFKPNTDDVREASSAVLIQDLLKAGISSVSAYDPIAMETFKTSYPHLNIQFKASVDALLTDVDVLVICTEWDEFKDIQASALQASGIKTVFDGRNIFSAETLNEHGIDYYAIGRGLLKAKE